MNDTELAGLLGFGKADNSPTLAWGKVLGVSGDTVTANVMGGTVSAVRCCGCSVGDIVALEGQRGRWRAIGRKGGEGGSDIDLPLSMANGGTGVQASDFADLADKLGFIKKMQFWKSGEAHNVDDLTSGVTFAYTSHNAPTTGTIATFSSYNNNYPFQIQTTYNSNYMYYRSFNGDSAKSWSAWHMVDGVVAQGTSGNCEYWKFADGLAIIIATVPSKSYAINTASTYAGYKSASQSVAIPFPLIAASAAAITGWEDLNAHGYVGTGSTGSKTLYYWLHSKSSASYTTPIYAFIIGKWK